MLISVHVPKTAGTSFRNSLVKTFGERLLLDYSTQPSSRYLTHRASYLKHKYGFLWKGRKIVSRYEVIHGHFPADMFDFLPGPKQFCMFMRQPVDRLVSHYLFWKRDGSKFPGNSALDSFIRNRLTLDQFAALPEMINFYSTFLGAMKIEQFDFVGLMEEYNTSLCLFEKIFGIKLDENWDNVTSREQKKDILSNTEVARLLPPQARNQEIYDQARRRFDLLCSQYL